VITAFEIVRVDISFSSLTSGVIMCNQAKILDLQQRNAQFIEKAPDDIIFEAADIISGFVEVES